MNDNQHGESSGGLALDDIYFVLFRHKWKIVICAAVGILAATATYLYYPSPYQSDAKLFIRYVLETKLPRGMGDDPQIKSPDTRGDSIINSEVEILTSLDLAGLVAEAVGPEKILAKLDGGNDRNVAAAVVKKGLLVEVPKQSSVLHVSFQHPDPDIVQPVMTQLIASYFKKHVEVHRSVGVFDDFLTQQTDTLRSRLAQTEDELRKAKAKVGVMSLEDSKKAYTEQISKIQQAMFDAQAEIAEQQAALQELSRALPGKNPATNSAVSMDGIADKVIEYKNIVSRLNLLRRKEQELLSQFTEESARVKETRQIAAAESQQQRLEAEHPELAALNLPATNPAGQPVDYSAERTRLLANGVARLMALQAKTNILTSQLETVLSLAGTINEQEGPILLLQRKRDLEESQYRYFSSSLEQARFDEALGAGKVSNISVVESPSPPFRDSRKLGKLLAGLAVGGVALGLLLAFFIELLLDRTLRRPKEIEARLHLPLFLSIPDTNWNGRSRKPKDKNKRTQLPAANGQAATGTLEIAPWEASHRLRPFYEALRDRLVANFEIRNLTRKPKLVAVTGCNEGSGVTSIAAGLAATLSEIGEGNVLLVDMNLENGAAHPFFKGKLNCGLDDLLESSSKNQALVHQNLYMAAEGNVNDALPRVLPKRFSSLVPKLKASDYDYIIFDMPPVSQTSVTPRLAGFMDMMLLVVESEKTDREVARRAGMLLEESKAHVCAVLNKTRTYVPTLLHREFLDGV